MHANTKVFLRALCVNLRVHNTLFVCTLKFNPYYLINGTPILNIKSPLFSLITSFKMQIAFSSTSNINIVKTVQKSVWISSDDYSTIILWNVTGDDNKQAIKTLWWYTAYKLSSIMIRSISKLSTIHRSQWSVKPNSKTYNVHSLATLMRDNHLSYIQQTIHSAQTCEQSSNHWFDPRPLQAKEMV